MGHDVASVLLRWYERVGWCDAGPVDLGMALRVGGYPAWLSAGTPSIVTLQGHIFQNDKRASCPRS